jgi:molecular chaperone DnaK (HSP70)
MTKLRNTLDLDPDVQKPVDLVVYVDPQENTEAQIAADFEYARDNMYEFIEQSKAALVDMIDVAKQSQHPKLYEAMNNMLKITAEINKDLLELHKTKKDLGPAAEASTNIVNNNLFLTTEELNKMLEDAKANREQ